MHGIISIFFQSESQNLSKLNNIILSVKDTDIGQQYPSIKCSADEEFSIMITNAPQKVNILTCPILKVQMVIWMR